jgi:hypothetical protein
MLLDDTTISTRYFFPRRAPIDDPFEVRAGDGSMLACYHSAPHANAKTFLHFHGNGEVVGDYIPDYVEAINGMGLNVFLAEYRGYGGSTGEPAMQSMLGDVEHIARAVGVPDHELIVYGRSVGSIYAIELAHRRPSIAALIIESGIADVHERLVLRVQPRELGVTADELRAAVAESFDHESKLGRYQGPLLVIHAQDDDLVDWSHAQRNHRWAASEDKELLLFQSGGHNAIMAANWDRYLRGLKRFFDAIGA